MEVNLTAPPKSKVALAKQLGVSRQSLYYQPKLPEKDLLLKLEIEAVMENNKGYGHKRVADALSMNKKRIRRVMKLFGLKPKRSRKPPLKPSDQGQAPMTIPNLVKGMLIEAPGMVWVYDFTYLWFLGRFVYLATVEDIFTREIVGFAVSVRHDANLVCQAMTNALENHQAPEFGHSDQGSEYRSAKYQSLLTAAGITPSMSKKGSPWENGYQESFYSQFKLELGHPECYANLGELIEAIALQIHYYNHRRIHTALRCAPVTFAARYQTATEVLKIKKIVNFQNTANILTV
ncbi:MAG: hypothetical protein A3C50_04160 [Candidatus Staskawiczbacteria bacterium RIFCSPHIGHO2_02_FULL_43_16]|nr:MAG: hypothetical protein A3C50_04160 [Candidatus Staskawiczbacteria bacterium RIFCSPHIGHO2_02_FULL_43_16]